MTFFEEMLEIEKWTPPSAIQTLLLADYNGDDEVKEEFCRLMLEFAKRSIKEKVSIRQSFSEYVVEKTLQKEEVNPLAGEFIRIYHIFKAHFNKWHVTPYEFISWAMSVESISVPEEMVKWKEAEDVFLMALQLQDEEHEREEAERREQLDPRLETSYKVLLAALLKHAGKHPWRENVGKAAAVKWLSRELDALGCAMSERTIGRCLDGLEDAIRKKGK